jgi:hypothetical protein
MCNPTTRIIDADEVDLMKSIRMDKLRLEAAEVKLNMAKVQLAVFEAVYSFENKMVADLRMEPKPSWGNRSFNNLVKMTDSLYLQLTNDESHAKKRKREEDAESSDFD